VSRGPADPNHRASCDWQNKDANSLELHPSHLSEFYLAGEARVPQAQFGVASSSKACTHSALQYKGRAGARLRSRERDCPDVLVEPGRSQLQKISTFAKSPARSTLNQNADDVDPTRGPSITVRRWFQRAPPAPSSHSFTLAAIGLSPRHYHLPSQEKVSFSPKTSTKPIDICSSFTCVV
jgi:hypothetical protein